MSSYSIAENFNKYFKIKFASSKTLRQEAFKIRYGVYSRELGWEPENELEMETDEYDDHSYHCLLEHRRTEVFAGCIRLIIPPVQNPTLQLPFEANCLDSARKEVLDPSSLERGSFSEISRLAVLDSFRRRNKEKSVPFVISEANPETMYSEEERRNFPNIAIGLYLGGLALANLCNHKGMFVMMEPRLNKRLQRFGLPFEQVGDVVDYHGMRAMFYLDKNKFNSELSDELLALYKIIYKDLTEQISLVPFTDNTDK
ncbi:PEP-CTERM/exosortase system-associated acyltransferase [Pseudocolwellia sp. AS88]|uniref:PEP-CTERM/exosortase system-associated acyltransferase n=1 Tax=Pseudocolwellia sp. AS88 TaxID=3063958 RepID=UPI0026F32D5C|nr:PEP-CTERM/exosortase system-associated acyltransferase [Pseudocolwellia sp. AS88]MDO7084099.1 PEP-CTERM/exosortase system-associated acyltransferase [Pseudocolwellia sp. AS88]